jgi:hypothetical protein
MYVSTGTQVARSEGITDFVLQCGHCGNKAPMEILANQSLVETHQADTPSIFAMEWDMGQVYMVLRCFSCSEPTFYQMSIHTGIDPGNLDRSYDKILYPNEPNSPRALPKGVQMAWNAAMRVRRIDPNAFAVLLGRVLESICRHENAVGSNLSGKIADLASRRVFPDPLAQVAHGLRKLRNFGAHGTAELRESDVPLLQSLCSALLTHLYSLPALAKDAHESLDRIASSEHLD